MGENSSQEKEVKIAAENEVKGSAEKEIDLIELARKLWAGRKLILKWCAVGVVVGLIVAFSIPKEYTASVKLAPEANDAKASGNLGALAAMAGFGGSGGGGSDAVYPALYPDIMSSVPFMLSMLDIPVTVEEGQKPIKLSAYLENAIHKAWWSAILGLPGKLIGAIRSSDEEDLKNTGKNAFHLTPKEDSQIAMLRNRITCSVDAKTSVVTVSANMQNPLVAAVVVDSVTNRIKEYITNYRTSKSRNDMMYVEKLTDEAKEEYYAAQQRYAHYLDTHQGIVMYSAQTMRDRLENEATLAFNVYNQMAQRLEVAKAKVQEETPVFATINPATVPLKASAPKKPMILIGFFFLSFVGGCAWILFVRPLLSEAKLRKGTDSAR